MIKLRENLKSKVYHGQGDNHSLSGAKFLTSGNKQKCHTSELELRE